jgi:uncharacterized protein YndB with AHSA1/START domain
MNERQTLTIERTYAAPVERVFEAFTSEEVMRRWWHAGPDWETPEARVDLRVGGEMRVVMRNPHKNESYGGGGRYTVVDPPDRVAFTWLWDDDLRPEQVEQLIEIDFSESDGQTTVRFVHRDLWDDETVADHEDGWNKALDNLKREVESA